MFLAIYFESNVKEKTSAYNGPAQRRGLNRNFSDSSAGVRWSGLVQV